MATQGNQFWKNRQVHGRPTKFENADQLWNSCTTYFEWCEQNPLIENKVFSSQGAAVNGELEHMRPFTLGGLCIHIGIGKTTWRDYRKMDKFKETCAYVDEIIYEQKFSGAAVGLFNQLIMCRDLGLVERTETDISNKDGTLAPRDFNDFYKEPAKKPAAKKAPAKKKPAKKSDK